MPINFVYLPSRSKDMYCSLLDRETTVATYAFSTVSLLAFSFILALRSHVAVFIAVFILG